MYAMNDKNRQKITNGKTRANMAKECAYLAVFVALVIALQVVFAMVPGVELVTVMFVSYAFVFGWKRGMIAATVFTLLRQVIFGAYPTVLVLYLVYFNLLTLVFGLWGAKIKKPIRALPWVVIAACFATACFTMLDNLLTTFWYGYSQRAREVYFMASLPVMTSQIICSAASVAVLFIPLQMVFARVKRSLRG